jgi:hypothetical protein
MVKVFDRSPVNGVTMRFRKTLAATVAVASLGAGAVAFAPTAGAQTDPGTTTDGRKEAACTRAHDAYQRLVAANQRAIERYGQLRDFQQRLVEQGKEQAARRLDARLDRMKQVHARLQERVVALREKVQNRCNEDYPDLPAVG